MEPGGVRLRRRRRRGTRSACAENEAAWRRYRLRPRVLVDVAADRSVDDDPRRAGRVAGRDRADGRPRARPPRRRGRDRPRRGGGRRPVHPLDDVVADRSRRSPRPRPTARAGSSSTPRPIRAARDARRAGRGGRLRRDRRSPSTCRSSATASATAGPGFDLAVPLGNFADDGPTHAHHGAPTAETGYEVLEEQPRADLTWDDARDDPVAGRRCRSSSRAS